MFKDLGTLSRQPAMASSCTLRHRIFEHHIFPTKLAVDSSECFELIFRVVAFLWVQKNLSQENTRLQFCAGVAATRLSNCRNQASHMIIYNVYDLEKNRARAKEQMES